MSRGTLDERRLERSRSDAEPLVEVEGLCKYFESESGFLASIRGAPDVKAVDDVSFRIRQGETLALVGESGCGKSTLARALLQLDRPTAGTVRFDGEDLTELSDAELRPRRQDMQMIFQDPHSSLNPRMTVGRIVEEPMEAHDLQTPAKRTERAKELLEKVGLDASHYDRHPHEFSGGQRQRVNLARALSTDPQLIVCDEPVSALDVSIQAQVLNTMRSLQDEFDVTYLFISHDLSVVRYIADRVAVMYLGRIAELAETEELFENPQHPYTRALLESIPIPDPRKSDARGVLEGDVPSPSDPPSGCRFRTRCPELLPPDPASIDTSDLSEAVTEAICEEYGLSETEWENVRAFTRAVRRRSFTLEGSAHPGDAAAHHVDRKFFASGRPDGDTGAVIDRAVELLADDRWDEAGELLSRTFEEPSPCAIEEPEYVVETVHGTDEHHAACHLHR